MSKQKIWELIEAYRTSGGSEEHHARKELLDAALDKALARRTWVGLTDEQKHQLNQSLNLQGRFPIIDAIEAICKGNNT